MLKGAQSFRGSRGDYDLNVVLHKRIELFTGSSGCWSVSVSMTTEDKFEPIQRSLSLALRAVHFFDVLGQPNKYNATHIGTLSGSPLNNGRMYWCRAGQAVSEPADATLMLLG